MLMCFGLIVGWVFFIGAWLDRSYQKTGYIVGLAVFLLVILLCVTVFQSRTALVGYCVFLWG